MENSYKIKLFADEKDLEEMIKLDEQYYQLQSYKVMLDLCKHWICKNNKIYTVLMYENLVVGYINFMPITKETYEKFKSGKIIDSDIRANDILNESEYGLFCSIVIKKEYRKLQPLKMMYDAFWKKIKEQKIKKFVCTAVSAEGARLARKHQFVGKDKQDNAIYEIVLD